MRAVQRQCLSCGQTFESRNGVLTCSTTCKDIRRRKTSNESRRLMNAGIPEDQRQLARGKQGGKAGRLYRAIKLDGSEISATVARGKDPSWDLACPPPKSWRPTESHGGAAFEPIDTWLERNGLTWQTQDDLADYTLRKLGVNPVEHL